MKITRILFALLAAGMVLSLGQSDCWATNTRTLGFNLTNPYQAGSCTFCHGSGANGQYWPDGGGGSPAYADNSAGAHDNHILAISQYHWGETLAQLLLDTLNGTSHDKQVTACKYCHPNPGGAGHTANTVTAEIPVNEPPPVSATYRDPENRANVYQDTDDTTTQGEVFGKFDGTLRGTPAPFDPIKDPTGADGDQKYNYVTKTCATLACHYRTLTPVYGGQGWDDGDDVAYDPDCETCHFYRDGGTYPQNAYVVGELPDAHQVHVAGIAPPSDSQSKGYPCAYCHDVAGYTTSHGNGAIDLTADGAPNDNIDLDPLDEGFTAFTAAVKYGTGAGTTCNNFYCHGADFSGADDGTGGTRGTDITPVWNDHTTGTCGDCHDTDVDGQGGATQAFDQGAHTSHIPTASGGVLYGPGFVSHYPSCAICHGFKDPQGGGFCSICHSPHPTIVMPGSPGDIGREWAPSASHVEGNFEVDFANQDRGWNALPDGFVAVGTIAPLGTTFNTGTDICNRCHSTTTFGGVVGGTLAKQEWEGVAHVLPCENCHNEDAIDSAFSLPVTGGVAAPGKVTNFAARGHGLPSGSTYPWSSARNGAGAVCTDCHDNTVAHLSAASGDTDRLNIAGNALCNNCHDGPGGGGSLGNAVSQVSTHANTSTTMTNVYTAQRPAMELNCVECHDVHGTANIFMINDVNPDGPLVAVRIYQGNDADDEPPPVSPPPSPKLFNGTVAFTNDASGADYAVPAADATKICQTCHTQTGHYQFDGDDGHVITDCITCHKHEFDDNTAANSQDGFMPSGCDGCHGFPPAPVGATTPPLENYAGGGGAHQQHVDFLIAQLSIPPTEVQGRAVELCGPCHGEDPLANHAKSNQAADAWPIAARGEVNIVARTQSSWGAAGTYRGQEVDPSDVVPNPEGGAKPPGSAMTNANSLCANLDCHGDADPGENLHWNVDTAADTAGDPEDGLAKSQVCEGCHDDTPAQVRAYPAAGPPTYTGNAPDAAANYYGTLSGYGRGGHGDAEIRNEDPFINSGTGNTPIDCTACHADAAAHFPAVAGNLNRLATIELENTSHSSAGLCNSCHPGASYPGPGNHHPSLQGTATSATRDIVVSAASQEVRQLPTSWFAVSTDHYEQDGYSAANASGNSDVFVDWWGGNPTNANQSPPPQPSPFAVLPLLQFVGNQSGTTNAVMCVTCHNPHGTDLYVFDPGGIGQKINDNNMLRLRDEDNTLCNACH